MRIAMFHQWENFFLIVGPSAGALIGLMFIVVTLSQGRDRKQFEAGKHLYTSPVVWHLGIVLALSGSAVAPTMTPLWFGSLAILLALSGLALGIRSAVGIAKVKLSGHADNMFDMCWYGIVPALTYVALAASAIAMLSGSQWGETAVAAALMVLLLVSIHAEWDLVTFLAPLANAAKDKSG